MKINNKEVIGDSFFYDGCHKIYIIEDRADLKTGKKAGYLKSDIFAISSIKQVYKTSCPLRFISNMKGTTDYVKQFKKAVFKN